MSLEIIGAGFGRTGTMSLKLALEVLGFERCYHMTDVIKGPPKIANTWLNALRGQIPQWDEVFKGYKAAVDWPSVYFLPELIQRYPKAKIILTVRDAETWYHSANRTIFKAIKDLKNDLMPRHQKLSLELIINSTFDGRIDDKDYVIQKYRDHIAWVTKNIPESRLICLDIKSGWKGLCAALALPVPNSPFPHVNTEAEFQDQFLSI